MFAHSEYTRITDVLWILQRATCGVHCCECKAFSGFVTYNWILCASNNQACDNR